MIIYEIVGDEQHPTYQALEVSNGIRQYHFLRSLVEAAAAIGRPFLSQHILKALNFHAITCLHTNAGEYRPCPVFVNEYTPPDHYRVSALMDDFINVVNRSWVEADEITLGAYVLWRLNHIHPFINGNGRTARAACYFVICMKLERWLPGTTILPELIRQNREEYYAALKEADENGDISRLHAYLSQMIDLQLATVETPVADTEESPG
jgi:Fic family protein